MSARWAAINSQKQRPGDVPIGTPELGNGNATNMFTKCYTPIITIHFPGSLVTHDLSGFIVYSSRAMLRMGKKERTRNMRTTHIGHSRSMSMQCCCRGIWFRFIASSLVSPKREACAGVRVGMLRGRRIPLIEEKRFTIV